MTAGLLVLSAPAGRLAQRIGPRLPMSLGPVVAATGLALMVRIGDGADYVGDVLPAVLVFALGLSLTVAPLTAAVLAAASDEHAGIASGVNNDVARVGGLIAIAVIPPLAGITGGDYLDPGAFGDGFIVVMWIAAGTCASGGALAWMTIRRARPEDLPVSPHCALDGPPYRRGRSPRTQAGPPTPDLTGRAVHGSQAA